MKEKKFTPNVTGSEKTGKTKNGRTLLKVKCASCGITKTRFISSQEGSGFSKKIVEKIPVIGPLSKGRYISAAVDAMPIPYVKPLLKEGAKIVEGYLADYKKLRKAYNARKIEQLQNVASDAVKESLGLLRRQKPDFKSMSRAKLVSLLPHYQIMHPITRKAFHKALSSKGISWR